MLNVATRFMFAAILVAVAPAQAATPQPPRPPALLAAFDADHDGRLTAQELHAARQQQVSRFDANGDGRLSTEEYQAWWLDSVKERLQRQFQADDRNKDGLVSLEELVQRADELMLRRDADRDGALTADELRRKRRTAQPG